ncbi:MAG: hypothetical protein MJ252_18390, partial [archaeon]|nr:hypothetical protein [archaeon]
LEEGKWNQFLSLKKILYEMELMLTKEISNSFFPMKIIKKKKLHDYENEYESLGYIPKGGEEETKRLEKFDLGLY